MVVDAKYNVQYIAHLDWRCHNHPLRTPTQVAQESFRCEKPAGALKHEIHAKVTPRNITRSAVFGKSELAIANPNLGIRFSLDVFLPFPLDSIESQQVRRRSCSTLDLVDMNDIKPMIAIGIVLGTMGCTEGRPLGEPADSAHPVNAYFHPALRFIDSIIV